MIQSSAFAGPAGSAAETVLHALRRRIIEGGIPPGARLVDATVAEQHGVSRNTARDALRLLAADGLAVSVRNAGYSVRELTVEDIRDLYTARRIVEAGAVQQSVSAASELFERVEQAVARTEASVRAGDWSQVGTGSLDFHRALVGLAMSSSLDRFFVGTVAQLRLAFAVIPDEGAFQVQWVPRDREIAELVLSGAREEAAAALASYLDDSEARVIDAIRAANRARHRSAAAASGAAGDEDDADRDPHDASSSTERTGRTP
ncbi:GntR family transcriptional regulator [Leucobacter sp. CSA1]|uniref:GntR family transcriptional regulator n=1 Tax=Leucobacter chromiisoli TaxID=2796471 RepID=A0A934Q6Q6_9MICO|nr:GntR family transcriptional regulator [Leucobacter chromiisoli]MBK0419279.1 GntR family transcriptional regulator [Leucobacter chromiisoli]